ncbi:MAG: hypothetical protein IPH96_17420 [Saprospiraceae bacterium]|nr:hypothetical protein [Saprospiraceae bacterium]
MIYFTRTEDLEKGDIIWVDVPQNGMHLSVVPNKPTKKPRGFGDDKYNARAYTISHHAPPFKESCEIEMTCDIIPPELFGKTCDDDNSSSYLRTDNPIPLRRGQRFKRVGNIGKHKDLLDEICRQVAKCNPVHQNSMDAICPCQKPEPELVESVAHDFDPMCLTGQAIGNFNPPNCIVEQECIDLKNDPMCLTKPAVGNLCQPITCQIDYHCPYCFCSWGNEATYDKVCNSCLSKSLSNKAVKDREN